MDASKVQTKRIKIKKKNSLAFRSVSRDTKAAWGNRIEKDVNDLSYDIKYGMIKGKGSIKNLSKNRETSDTQQFQSLTMRPETSITKKTNNRVDLIKANKEFSPEKFNLQEKPIYSTLDTNGLCKFQFQKTIKGKLTFKPNHHLSFQNQTQRPTNINAVWYNPQLQIQRMSRTITPDKYHDFNSYTQRNVFRPKDEVDRLYSIRKSKQKCTAKRIKETVQIDKITGRIEPKPQPSHKLTYSQYQAQKYISPRSPSYEIPKTQRKIQFGPQVIWSKRGCYR